ncbi:MAG: PilN domain-containing protein [Actinomycetota bacterium]
MMRRIDLLPSVYAQRRQERRNIALIIIAGMLIFLLFVGWWVILGFRINAAEQDLSDVQAQNQALEEDIAALQEFVELQNEVDSKRGALQTVMAGDLDWPALMTEIAMVIPGEVWLTNLTASAGATEGAAPVGTETNAIQIASEEPVGRIQFQGQSLTMPGVAKWMIRLESVEEFFAVYLNSASVGGGEETVETVSMDTTLELGPEALSGRFQQQGQTP